MSTENVLREIIFFKHAHSYLLFIYSFIYSLLTATINTFFLAYL